ncbi:hypothetical protein Tco_0793237 [Tanacetum coccineum]
MLLNTRILKIYHPDKVYKVIKALYGLHQAPKAWLISWQCKKQTVVATSTTEAEYVAAASCYLLTKGFNAGRAGQWCQDTILGDVDAQTRFETTSKQSNDLPLSRGYTLGSREDINAARPPVQVNAAEGDSINTSFCVNARANPVNGERQLQALIDKKKVIIMESSIRSDLHLEDAGGTDCLPTATIFEELARMGYEKPSQKLTFYKDFFSPQWKFLIHTITQCLSAKSTAWNEFSSTMASLIICLATNKKFNLSKYIFDAMVKHLDEGVKFLLYPRFLQVFINQQLGDLSHHKKIYVLNLEKAKDAQAKEIADLKKRVQKLERKKKSNTTGLKILKKVGMSRRVESSEDKETLGRSDNEEMFDINDLHSDEVNVDMPVGEKQEQSAKERETLIQIKVAKPKVVTTAATKTTTTRPKAKEVVVQEPSEFRTPHESQPSMIKDKGKAIMIEPKLEVELIEEERLARKQEKEANIALIESWDNTQAMMKADFELAQRLQTEEQREITIEERSRLFVELMNKRKKHFAMLRAKEKRRKPPTKAQKRNLISTYLKNMGGYKHNQLKSKSYEEIQKMFDNEMRRVNTFIPMDSEVDKSKKETEESSKGIEDELKSDKSKKAESNEEKAKGSRKKMLDEHEEVEEDDEAELKKYLVIVKDDDIAIDAIPLATKPPVIVEYKLLKEGIMAHYQLIRADGSSKRYSSMIRMLYDINKEDLETLWKLVKTKHGDIRPEDEHERVLWGDLKVMFEPDIKSDVWRNLQGYKVTIWKLYDSCGVHFVRFENVHIFMLVEKRYPLTPITITNMLNKKLQTDYWNEMCYQLLKLMVKQQKGQ